MGTKEADASGNNENHSEWAVVVVEEGEIVPIDDDDGDDVSNFVVLSGP